MVMYFGVYFCLVGLDLGLQGHSCWCVLLHTRVGSGRSGDVFRCVLLPTRIEFKFIGLVTNTGK